MTLFFSLWNVLSCWEHCVRGWCFSFYCEKYYCEDGLYTPTQCQQLNCPVLLAEYPGRNRTEIWWLYFLQCSRYFKIRKQIISGAVNTKLRIKRPSGFSGTKSGICRGLLWEVTVESFMKTFVVTTCGNFKNLLSFSDSGNLQRKDWPCQYFNFP